MEEKTSVWNAARLKAVGLAVVFLISGLFYWWYDSRTEHAKESGSAFTFAVTETDTPKEISASVQNTIHVFVCGAVVCPDVYEFPAGALAKDAVIKAGGFRKDADQNYCNLAERLTDGQKLYIPTKEEASQAGSVSGEPAGAGKIAVNSADLQALMTLPGIGESKAEAILAYRKEHGPFQGPEDLMNVPGIKAASYEKIKEYITFNH